MNPGKLIDAYPVDANLRLGPDYHPLPLKTNFQFRSEVGNGFARAAEHCIGMGKCRSHAGGTMCPSYRATREERYSTRGRARLLSEMLRGEVITDGWASTEVREALDTCLACKGCRSDCPTHTDMAAYKAEFLSHHYEIRRRPRQAWSMGRIGEWAPLASRFSGVVNAVSGNSGLSKALAGVARERTLPKFAAHTFRSQFKPSAGGERVVLFDDTFNNHFRPQTAGAAQKLLEAAGCAVELPAKHVCCGRPYYDYGMLDEAKRALEGVLQVLAPQLDAGAPVVVLEPGCLSVFRDELRQLLPDDPRAARLTAQVMSLGEVLHKRGFSGKAEGRVLVHSHCHQKALWGAKADLEVLTAAGCEVIAPDTGCCGMSGSFGYKPEHVETSRRIAGLALLPALAGAKDAVVVASGFSCREQIEVACRPADAASRRNAGAAVSFEVLVYVALVCLLSGFAHGALGFGFPLVATPLVALVIDMKSAITLLAPVTLALVVISALRGASLRELVRRYWFMPVGIAAGAWLGTLVLLSAPPEPFMLVLALVLVLYLNLDRVGRGQSATVQRLRAPFGFAFAFLAGIFEAIANVAGPILFVYFMLLGAAPAQVVQTLNMCFTVGKGSQVLTLAAAGALSSATWAAVAGLTVPSVAALLAGMRVRDRIDAQTYRAWLRKALWVMVVLLLLQFSRSVFASDALFAAIAQHQEPAALELVGKSDVQTKDANGDTRAAPCGRDRHAAPGAIAARRRGGPAGAHPQWRNRVAPRDAPSGAAVRRPAARRQSRSPGAKRGRRIAAALGRAQWAYRGGAAPARGRRGRALEDRQRLQRARLRAPRRPCGDCPAARTRRSVARRSAGASRNRR